MSGTCTACDRPGRLLTSSGLCVPCEAWQYGRELQTGGVTAQEAGEQLVEMSHAFERAAIEADPFRAARVRRYVRDLETPCN